MQIASLTSSLFLLALSNTIYFEYFSTKVTIADFLAFPTIVSPSKWPYSILVLALGYFSSLSWIVLHVLILPLVSLWPFGLFLPLRLNLFISITPCFANLYNVFVDIFSSFPSILSLPAIASKDQSFSSLVLISSNFSLLNTMGFLPHLDLFIRYWLYISWTVSPCINSL